MSESIPKNLLSQIDKGEGITVEFKRSNDRLPSDLFESVCGMLNRNGGHIFLGVEDDGAISGINYNSVKKLKKDFANLCNNPQKIFPAVHLEIYEYAIQERVVLYVYVYESSDVHKTANRIFDRNEDGDFDITDNTHLVSQLYIRKSSTYIENKIYPYATLDDLRADLIERARRLANSRVNNHPWAQMSDLELLKSANLYERDLQTGNEGINLAGILLFGKDETIASALSYYRTDAVLRVKDTDRYDDRDDIRTNLIDSYIRLTAFVRKHTNEKFYIENGQRIDIRDIIARELCANLLIHREYSNPTPAQLLITGETITTTNANKPHSIGFIDINSFSPFPKNPKIAGFFKEIGYADELGSGIKKIAKYSRIYSNSEPSFEEGELFKAVVYLPGGTGHRKSADLRRTLLDFIIEHDGVSRKEINDYIYPLLEGYTEKQKTTRVHSMLTTFSHNGTIKNLGTNKAPQWFYSKNKQ